MLSPTAIVQSLLRVDGKENISIENNVVVQRMTCIAAVPLTGKDSCHVII
jgi:hypothetical protein